MFFRSAMLLKVVIPPSGIVTQATLETVLWLVGPIEPFLVAAKALVDIAKIVLV